MPTLANPCATQQVMCAPQRTYSDPTGMIEEPSCTSNQCSVYSLCDCQTGNMFDDGIYTCALQRTASNSNRYNWIPVKRGDLITSRHIKQLREMVNEEQYVRFQQRTDFNDNEVNRGELIRADHFNQLKLIVNQMLAAGTTQTGDTDNPISIDYNTNTRINIDYTSSNLIKAADINAIATQVNWLSRQCYCKSKIGCNCQGNYEYCICNTKYYCQGQCNCKSGFCSCNAVTCNCQTGLCTCNTGLCSVNCNDCGCQSDSGGCSTQNICICQGVVSCVGNITTLYNIKQIYSMGAIKQYYQDQEILSYYTPFGEKNYDTLIMIPPISNTDYTEYNNSNNSALKFTRRHLYRLKLHPKINEYKQYGDVQSIKIKKIEFVTYIYPININNQPLEQLLQYDPTDDKNNAFYSQAGIYLSNSPTNNFHGITTTNYLKFNNNISTPEFLSSVRLFSELNNMVDFNGSVVNNFPTTPIRTWNNISNPTIPSPIYGAYKFTITDSLKSEGSINVNTLLNNDSYTNYYFYTKWTDNKSSKWLSTTYTKNSNNVVILHTVQFSNDIILKS